MKSIPHYIILFSLIVFYNFTIAQSALIPSDIDVQHYQFKISVNDSTNIIKGTATISIKINKPIKEFDLDLSTLDINQKGMHVNRIFNKQSAVLFIHKDNKLNIKIPAKNRDSIQVYTIEYEGIPKDGLIISKNKFGERTFFGDNWPNRAKNWLPCVDNLTDKATVDFIVTAPIKYQVISNGLLIEQTALNDQTIQYHYVSKIPLPVYVMVVGISKFAIQNLGEFHQIPISTWVYPQNKEQGFYDYAQAISIVDYFVSHIAPFPYRKLANVQSKTRFGGMENASAIFYSEKSVTGKRDQEALMAHEIAHQWFGDSVTEKKWSHLWLSEGFATYFTNLYMENKYGKNKLKERLKKQREKVIRFSEKQKTPIIDTITTNYMKLLNANSYEKSAWFLHMLRIKIGDDFFWKSIKTYYDEFKYSNALTDDFKKIVEKISQKDLNLFFDQWLYGIGQPELDFNWNANSKKLNINQVQKTKTIFEFPLEVMLQFKNGNTELKTFWINQKINKIVIPIQSPLNKIIIDPNVSLLYKEK